MIENLVRNKQSMMMELVNFSLLISILLIKINVCCSISIKSRCEPFEVCNVVHNRYWLPNLIERQCICPQDSLCSSTYIKLGNEFTMNINARTQLKLCHPFQKSKCSNYELSVIQTRRSNHTKTKINCICNRTSYLKYYSKVTHKRQRSVTFKYQCVAMSTCEPDQFCGYARSDLGFVYQKCTCPDGYNCVTRSSTDALNGRMHELFYNGTVYAAHCVSFL